jgi:hypothetical protein
MFHEIHHPAIGVPSFQETSVYDHHRFKVGGRTQNVSYIFQGVFEGGLENVSSRILKTLPTKTTWGTVSDQFYI